MRTFYTLYPRSTRLRRLAFSPACTVSLDLMPRENTRTDNDDDFACLIDLLPVRRSACSIFSAPRYFTPLTTATYFLPHSLISDFALSRMSLQNWSMYTLQTSEGTLSILLHFHSVYYGVMIDCLPNSSSPIYHELILTINDTIYVVTSPAYLCSEHALVSRLPRRKLVPSLSDLLMDHRFSFLGLLRVLHMASLLLPQLKFV
ncbi:uncharacterized protein EDB93DRAFT_537061 [Suillus bovinus]|uniref:uncharacterized protein n=1 Tax=Suillus bovinus TaxID=48563 RepID=UPI001B87C7BA|nr:uncharacterized protein EDB93DRAFT_537061 [Suillus bovinus]KAG2144376.1 hypothetical protein EDB93DRAFT_537061 [Suillus bovinus]